MSKRLTQLTLAVLLLWAPLAGAQQVEYYHLDGLGSVRAISDEQGVVVERHDYLPFGEEWNPEPGGQPRKFTGKERDEETGWDYFGARYYEASLARFVAVDPVTTFADNRVDPQRWNRYAYVRNNPLRYVDPDGKIAVTATLAIAWAAFEIGSQIYDAYSTAETLADPNVSARDKAVVTGLFVAGIVAPGGGYSSAAKAGLRKADNAAGALAGPGQDLFVGTYNQVRRGNLQSGINATHTPHHVVQNAVSPSSRGRGVSINLSKDLHARTRTFRRPVERGVDQRTHLARDVRDLRNVLREAGYDRSTVNRQLGELIRQNKENLGQ